MSGSNRGSGGRQGDQSTSGRSPRSRKADVVERHADPAARRTSGNTDASTAARGTQSGRRDTRMADPDAPTESRASGRSSSRMREGGAASPGAGQGIGAGKRRRAGTKDD